MNYFDLQIVTFEKLLVDEQVTSCAVYTETGKIGFKALHEAFISILRENSEVEFINKAGKKNIVKITNGIFSFKNNTCVITAYVDS